MYCVQCAFSSSDYSEWKSHLISALHQIRTHDKVQTWEDFRNRRSVVVQILESKPGDGSMSFSHDKVYNYFAGFSSINDFYMHPDATYFVVELENRLLFVHYYYHFIQSKSVELISGLKCLEFNGNEYFKLFSDRVTHVLSRSHKIGARNLKITHKVAKPDFSTTLSGSGSNSSIIGMSHMGAEIFNILLLIATL